MQHVAALQDLRYGTGRYICRFDFEHRLEGIVVEDVAGRAENRNIMFGKRLSEFPLDHLNTFSQLTERFRFGFGICWHCC